MSCSDLLFVLLAPADIWCLVLVTTDSSNNTMASLDRNQQLKPLFVFVFLFVFKGKLLQYKNTAFWQCPKKYCFGLLRDEERLGEIVLNGLILEQ